VNRAIRQALGLMQRKQYCEQVKEFLYMQQNAQTLFGNPKFKSWERHAFSWLIELVEKELEYINAIQQK
jgi:hypothetical protein